MGKAIPLRRRQVSAPTVLVVGVLLGLLLSRLLSWAASSPRRVVLPKSHQQSHHPVELPTLEQRLRVLKLLTHLSPYHTRECTRNAQALYKEQVEDRYAPLVAKKPPPPSSWSTSWLPFASFLSFPSLAPPPPPEPAEHKYFFAINLYNSFSVIPDLFATLFRVASILGLHNVHISIYENGSTDQTKALLLLFSSLSQSIGLHTTIRSSPRTRGAFNHRIEYLAEIRNAALIPLHDLRSARGVVFDSIVFMNDVLPCPDDLLELLLQSRMNNAGITCAADYMYHDELAAPVFYDNWVARDINGTALENAPFERIFHHHESGERFQRHLPVQVQSCWNGIAVLDPAAFYEHPNVRFRLARLAEGECSASECSLICNDYWDAGYGRIMMVPRVKLAYDEKVYNIIHPPRQNLTAIRGYAKLGGLPDDPLTVSDPQDRAWFGPHDRLFTKEESVPLEFKNGPEYVWCWGWDGAGDLDGPDVEPIWERTSNRSRSADAVKVRHDRSLGVPLPFG